MSMTVRCNGSCRRLGAALLLAGILVMPMNGARAGTPPLSPPDVLTLGEAASLLRIGTGELRGMAARNEVPSRRIGARWRFNRATLMAWLNGDWTLITTAVPPSGDRAGAPPAAGSPLAARDMARVTGAGTSISQTPSQDDKKPAKEDREPIGEAPKERTAEEVFLRGQKVLLAPGAVAVEAGQFFSRSDDNTVSNGSLATIEQQAFTTFVQGRVGVLDETELFASTTFRHRNNDVFVGNIKTFQSERSEFGDIRLGVRHTLLHEGPGRPNIIATVDGRIPTGHTSYAIGGGLAFVKSVDPVVLFANGNYLHTFSRDFGDMTLLEPENRFDVSLGYALALNDTLTISTSLSGVYTDATRFANATLRQRDSYSLSFGLTSWLAEGLYVEPTVSFGLSGPGNSVAFGVTVPYSF